MKSARKIIRYKNNRKNIAFKLAKKIIFKSMPLKKLYISFLTLNTALYEI